MNTTETYTTTLNGDTVRFEEDKSQTTHVDGDYVVRGGTVFVTVPADGTNVEITDPNTLDVAAVIDEPSEHINPDTLIEHGFTALTEVKA